MNNFSCELHDDTFVWRYMSLDRPIVNKDCSFAYEALLVADVNAWRDVFVMLE